MSKSLVKVFTYRDAHRTTEPVLRAAMSLLLSAVDEQRLMGYEGRAYQILPEWVVAVGDRADGEDQGIMVDADYYAIVYPIGSEPAAHILQQAHSQKGGSCLPVPPGAPTVVLNGFEKRGTNRGGLIF